MGSELSRFCHKTHDLSIDFENAINITTEGIEEGIRNRNYEKHAR